MSERYPGGLIRKTPPTVTGPTDGEGGSAPGIWTLEEVAYYEKEGGWPKPTLPRELYMWGTNGFGMLGDNSVVAASSPVQVGADTNWSKIVGSKYSTYAIKQTNSLWSWGYDEKGALGQNTNLVHRSSPVQIGSLTNWDIVEGGNEFAYAIKTDGTLWSWGNNLYGTLGQGDSIYRSSPTQVGSDTWATVSSGNTSFALMIKTDGTLWAVGNNSAQYAFGNGTTTDSNILVQTGTDTDWSSVAAGLYGGLAIKTDGTLWAWGYNGYGVGGNSTSTAADIPTPVQVGALTTWSKVSYDSRTVYAIRTDGTLWAWGYGSFGLCAQNTRISYSSPVQIGSGTWKEARGQGNFAAAITSSGELYSWGDNGAGGLGQNTPITLDRSSPVQIGSASDWLSLAGGSEGGNFIGALKTG
jgi:alpha-tubulin suppressor-like RCC1 family protein